MSNPHPFRTWLRRRRMERGLTQDELGELAGYAGQTITKIEGGQRRPSPQLAMRLAQVLQIAPDEQAAWMSAALGDVEPAAPAPAAPAVAVAVRQPLPSPGLPAYLTPFVGREREQAELAALLARPDCRLVTTLGPGGVGKTRLAIETGRALPGFADGVAFVPLAPVAAPESIVPAIGDALGVTFSGAGELAAQLLAHLADMRALLILDNLEHLLDPEGATLRLLELLLARAPGVSLLVTSRERLRLAGEWVLELGGLAVAAPRAAGPQASAPALALFAEHAERVDRAFRLTAENGAIVATICGLVDGLPLGIELAAAWTRLLALDEIVQELSRGLDAGHVAARSLPARHHSLRAVVEHSWALLNAEERATLRRLAVFQGGFSREAAAEVAGAHLGVLVGLADKSLLRRGGGGRYDLHEIIRQYAAARLGEDGAELEATRGRHAAYYLRLAGAREQALKGPDQAAATAELSAEIDNIRAAWPWAAAHAMHDELERAGETLHWFYEFRSWLQEGVDLFAQATERLRAAGGGAAQRRTLGRMLGHYGYLAMRLGAFAPAHAALAESHALLAAAGDLLGQQRSLLYQAQLTYWTGPVAEVRQLIERTIDLTAATGDRHVLAMARTQGSMAAHGTGDLAEAEGQFRAALATWRELGNPRGMVWCITACASTLLARGRLDEAQQLLRESLALSYSTRDTGGTAMSLHQLGRAALYQGDAEEAVYFLREALPMMRTASIWMYAHALNHLGAALERSGAGAEARRVYAEAFQTALRISAHQETLQALAGLAGLALQADQPAGALALAARALADPACRGELQHALEQISAAARAQLPADEAARVEAEASALTMGPALLQLAGLA